MFSPKAYVRDLIFHQLSDWIENIPENSVDVSAQNSYEYNSKLNNFFYFQLGVLDGDLQLAHLVCCFLLNFSTTMLIMHCSFQLLKKKSWVLSQGLSVSLEYGTIDKFSVQIPWSTIHTGLVNVFADHVSIVIRVNVMEYDPLINKIDINNDITEKDSFAHEFKMVSFTLHLNHSFQFLHSEQAGY